MRQDTRIVIPARLASTRLPEKLLLRETGYSLLEHTYRSASRARLADSIVVAVDHPRLRDEVERFGGVACMTNPNAQCGTERVAELAARFREIEYWINVQGDEPEIDPNFIDQVTELLVASPHASVATLATPIRSRVLLDDPNCVKVVCDHEGKALYFSRSPIPYPRTWEDSLLGQEPPRFLQHLGIYAYRRDFLMQLASLPASPLEQTEKLEQLRFLQAGHAILVGTVASAPRGIDTRDDYAAFVDRWRQAASSIDGIAIVSQE